MSDKKSRKASVISSQPDGTQTSPAKKPDWSQNDAEESNNVL